MLIFSDFLPFASSGLNYFQFVCTQNAGYEYPKDMPKVAFAYLKDQVTSQLEAELLCFACRSLGAIAAFATMCHRRFEYHGHVCSIW